MITIDSIEYQNSSIQIIDAAGDALNISADGSLPVNDNGGSLTVDAVNLDIRDLAFATDSVTAHQGGAWSVSVTGDVNVTQGTSPWVISGDIGGTFLEDSAHVSGDKGIQVLAVRNDTVSSLVGANGDYAPLQVSSLGGLRVVSPANVTDGATASTNMVQVGGSDGTNAQLFLTDTSGRLFVNVNGDVNVTQGTSPWVVSATDLDIRNLSASQDNVAISDGTDTLAVNADGSINVQTVEAGYASWSVVALSATTTEASISALSGRLRVEIQNLGSNDVYIRQITGVSAANGLKIPKGSSYEQALDAGAAIFYVSAAGTADLRVAQYAA